MNSEKYCQVFTNLLLPFSSEECPENWIFQNDNASCHEIKYTVEFLSDNFVDTLPRPARSPDPNVIENMRRILVRDVYKDCLQFASKEELKKVIHEAWNEISITTIRKLFDSMHKRCISVIERNGGKINH